MYDGNRAFSLFISLLVCNVGKVFYNSGCTCIPKKIYKINKYLLFIPLYGVVFCRIFTILLPIYHQIDEIFSTTRPEVTMQWLIYEKHDVFNYFNMFICCWVEENVTIWNRNKKMKNWKNQRVY